MNNRGVTLAELIVVITIIGILAVALGFSFQGWLGGYKIEKQAKEMYVDLMNTRIRAMQRNRAHFVSLTATQYTVYEDTNPAPDGNGTLEIGSDTQVLQRNLDSNYPVTWSDAGDVQIDFTSQGVSNDNKTICSNSSSDADYNCIEISATRINIGKLTTTIPAGGACNATNCVAR